MKEKVEEIMTRDVITATENDTVLNIVNVLRENSIAGVPVVNDREEVIGVVSVLMMPRRLCTLQGTIDCLYWMERAN
jgi:predicted transcriptional regulator